MSTHTSSLPSWADAWLDAVAAFSHPGRMRRGQRFAGHGKIRKFEVKPGSISASVKEEGNTYLVVIKLRQLDDATWDRIVRHLASQALFSARLLAGEMPAEVIKVFEELEAPLFPEAEALQASCTCPDWEVPCKHIAALYYLLAERFEEDPFLLFLARGRSKEELLAMLRQHRQTSTDADANEQETEEDFQAPPLSQTLDHFWDIGPSLDDLSFEITPPEAALPHLRRLGSPPFTQLDLESLLSPIYETVSEKARQWAFQEPGKTS